MELIQNIDFNILEFIRANMTSEFLNKIMPPITILGSGGFIWIVIAFIFIVKKKFRKDGLLLICSLLFCLLIGNLTLKPLVARIRPCDINTAVTLLIERPTDFSFPSGHTMTSFASALIIFNANKKLGIAAIILASLIAFSRLYLYVHFPSDIIAGLVIGLLISFSVINYFKFKNKIEKSTN